MLLSVVVFFAAMVRGYTGFGLSAVIVTTMSYWIPARELVPILIPLEITASLLFIRNISGSINWRTVGLIGTGAVVSTPIASLILSRLPAEITRAIIAGLVLLATLLLLSLRNASITPNKLTWTATGITMGAFNGLGSVGGLCGMVMLLATNLDAAKTRATMIALLLMTSCYGAIFSYLNGMLTSHTIQQSFMVVLPMMAGLAIGHFCYNSYEKSLRKATLVLLVILSGTMLMQSAWHFIS